MLFALQLTTESDSKFCVYESSFCCCCGFFLSQFSKQFFSLAQKTFVHLTANRMWSHHFSKQSESVMIPQFILGVFTGVLRAVHL